MRATLGILLSFYCSTVLFGGDVSATKFVFFNEVADHEEKPVFRPNTTFSTSNATQPYGLKTTPKVKTGPTGKRSVSTLVPASFSTLSPSAVRQLLLEHVVQPTNKQQNIDNLPTVVMAKLLPIKIQDLNEKQEVLETTLRLQLSWRDSRLAWDPAAFNNVSEIIIPGNLIWAPDIAILNSVSDIYHVVRDTRFEMKVENDGRVWWHPTGILKTYCKLHLRYFPFDRQNCSIVLESPTLDIKFMNLTLRSYSEPVDLAMYIGGETWDLLAVTGANFLNRVTTRTTFTRVEFCLRLGRSRIYHLLNVILPAIFLSCVQVMFFMLPVTHPQRVGSSATTLLSVVVFQSVAVSQLPKTSTDVPLLAVYIFIVIFISGLSVCTSIFVAKFAVYGDKKRPLPVLLRHIPHPSVICSYCILWCGKMKQKPAHELPGASSQPLQDVICIDEKAEKKKEAEVNENVALVPPSPEKTKTKIRMLTSWNEISEIFDCCLFSLAITLAFCSPVLLFVVIPKMVEDDFMH